MPEPSRAVLVTMASICFGLWRRVKTLSAGRLARRVKFVLPLVLYIRLTSCTTRSARGSGLRRSTCIQLEDATCRICGLFYRCRVWRPGSGGVVGLQTTFGPVFSAASFGLRRSGSQSPSLGRGIPGFTPYDATDGTRQVGFAFADLGGNIDMRSCGREPYQLGHRFAPYVFCRFRGICIAEAASRLRRPQPLLLLGPCDALIRAAASAVDLHPTVLAGFDRSVATGTDGAASGRIRQSGRGRRAYRTLCCGAARPPLTRFASDKSSRL